MDITERKITKIAREAEKLVLLTLFTLVHRSFSFWGRCACTSQIR